MPTTDELQLEIDALKKRLDEAPAYFGKRMTNALASPNYQKGNSGWLIEDNGNVEFANGTFRGKLIVDSLEQLKFVFNTNFESLDAWATSLTGGRGSVALDSIGAVHITTGNQANDEAQLAQSFGVYGKDYGTPITFSFTVWPQTPATTDFLLAFGSQIAAFANEDAGFWYESATSALQWYVRTGGVTVKGTITGYDVSEAHTYRVELDGGDTAKFYVDGELVKTQTSGLPTGTDAAVFSASFRTTTAAAKEAFVIDALYISDRYLP